MTVIKFANERNTGLNLYPRRPGSGILATLDAWKRSGDPGPSSTPVDLNRSEVEALVAQLQSALDNDPGRPLANLHEAYLALPVGTKFKLTTWSYWYIKVDDNRYRYDGGISNYYTVPAVGWSRRPVDNLIVGETERDASFYDAFREAPVGTVFCNPSWKVWYKKAPNGKFVRADVPNSYKYTAEYFKEEWSKLPASEFQVRPEPTIADQLRDLDVSSQFSIVSPSGETEYGVKISADEVFSYTNKTTSTIAGWTGNGTVTKED